MLFLIIMKYDEHTQLVLPMVRYNLVICKWSRDTRIWKKIHPANPPGYAPGMVLSRFAVLYARPLTKKTIAMASFPNSFWSKLMHLPTQGSRKIVHVYCLHV